MYYSAILCPGVIILYFFASLTSFKYMSTYFELYRVFHLKDNPKNQIWTKHLINAIYCTQRVLNEYIVLEKVLEKSV